MLVFDKPVSERLITGKYGERLLAHQMRLLDALGELRATRGYPPTIRDLMRHLGYKSPNAVFGLLVPLERSGFLKRDKAIKGCKNPRTLQLVGVSWRPDPHWYKDDARKRKLARKKLNKKLKKEWK